MHQNDDSDLPFGPWILALALALVLTVAGYGFWLFS